MPKFSKIKVDSPLPQHYGTTKIEPEISHPLKSIVLVLTKLDMFQTSKDTSIYECVYYATLTTLIAYSRPEVASRSKFRPRKM